jgi:hypothetical protein
MVGAELDGLDTTGAGMLWVSEAMDPTPKVLTAAISKR